MHATIAPGQEAKCVNVEECLQRESDSKALVEAGPDDEKENKPCGVSPQSYWFEVVVIVGVALTASLVVAIPKNSKDNASYLFDLLLNYTNVSIEACEIIPRRNMQPCFGWSARIASIYSPHCPTMRSLNVLP